MSISPPSPDLGNKVAQFFGEMWKTCLHLPKHLAHLAEKIKASVKELWVEWDAFWQGTATQDLSALHVQVLTKELNPTDEELNPLVKRPDPLVKEPNPIVQGPNLTGTDALTEIIVDVPSPSTLNKKPSETISVLPSPPSLPSTAQTAQLVSSVSNPILHPIETDKILPPSSPLSITAQKIPLTSSQPPSPVTPYSTSPSPFLFSFIDFFEPIFPRQNVATYNVLGDGSCYYYAVIVQLALSNNTAVWNRMTTILEEAQKTAPNELTDKLQEKGSKHHLNWTFSNKVIKGSSGNTIGGSFKDWIDKQGGVDAFKNSHNYRSEDFFYIVERLLRIAIANKITTEIAKDGNPLSIDLINQVNGCVIEAEREGISTKIEELWSQLSQANSAYTDKDSLYAQFKKLSLSDTMSKTTQDRYNSIMNFQHLQSTTQNGQNLKNEIESLNKNQTLTDLAFLKTVEERVGEEQLRKSREEFIEGIRDTHEGRAYGDAIQTRVLQELFDGMLSIRVWHDGHDGLTPSSYDPALSEKPILEIYHSGVHYQAMNMGDVSTKSKLQQILQSFQTRPPRAISELQKQEDAINRLYNSSFRHLIDFLGNNKKLETIKENIHQWLLTKSKEIQTLAAKKRDILKSPQKPSTSEQTSDKLLKIDEAIKKLNELHGKITKNQPFESSFEIYKNLYALKKQLNTPNLTYNNLDKDPELYRTYLEFTKNPPTTATFITWLDKSDPTDSSSFKYMSKSLTAPQSRPKAHKRPQTVQQHKRNPTTVTKPTSSQPLIPKAETDVLPKGAIHTPHDGACLLYAVLMSSILDDQAYEHLEKLDGFKKLIVAGGGKEQVRRFIKRGKLDTEPSNPFTKFFKTYAQTFRESVSRYFLEQLQSSSEKESLRLNMREALKDNIRPAFDAIKIEADNLDVLKNLSGNLRQFTQRWKGEGLDKAKLQTDLITFLSKNKLPQADALHQAIKKISETSSPEERGNAFYTLVSEQSEKLEKVIEEKEKSLDVEYENAAKNLCQQKNLGEFVSLEHTYALLICRQSFYFDHEAIDMFSVYIGINIRTYQQEVYKNSSTKSPTISAVAYYGYEPERPTVKVFFQKNHYSAYAPEALHPPTLPSTLATPSPSTIFPTEVDSTKISTPASTPATKEIPAKEKPVAPIAVETTPSLIPKLVPLPYTSPSSPPTSSTHTSPPPQPKETT